MICENNIVFSILYGSDMRLIRDMVNGSLERLELLWNIDDWHILHLKAVFFLLLDIDIGMKELIVKGTGGLEPMSAAKAEGFFLHLRAEAIEPFLTNTAMPLEDFLDSIKSLYLVY